MSETTVGGAARCTACGSALRPSAAYCTECGVRCAPDAESGSVAEETRVTDAINPATSRAILESVAGGRGGYVGSGTVAGATVSDAPPPPGSPERTPPEPEDAGRRRLFALVAVVAVVFVFAGLAILLATSGDDGPSLEAGGSGPGVVTARSASDADTSTSAPATSASTTTLDDSAAREAEEERDRLAQAEEARRRAAEAEAAEQAATEDDPSGPPLDQEPPEPPSVPELPDQQGGVVATAPPPVQQVPQSPATRVPNTVPRPVQSGLALAISPTATVPGAVRLTNTGRVDLVWSAKLQWEGTQPRVDPGRGTLSPGGSAVIDLGAVSGDTRQGVLVVVYSGGGDSAATTVRLSR